MTECVSKTEHVDEFSHIVYQLKTIVYPLDDELLTHCLLISMSNSWSTIVVVISGQEKEGDSTMFVTASLAKEFVEMNEVRQEGWP